MKNGLVTPKMILGTIAGVLAVIFFQNCTKQSSSSDFSSSSPVENMTMDLVQKSQSGAVNASDLDLRAKERRKNLLELAQKDPVQVLRMRIPEEKQEALPAQVKSLLEKQVEVEGELVVLHVDHENKEQSRLSMKSTVNPVR